MFKNKQYRRVSTVFRFYLVKYQVSHLIKNTCRRLPGLLEMSRNARHYHIEITASLLRQLFMKNVILQGKIAFFDIAMLRDKLRISLKGHFKHTSSLQKVKKVNFGQIKLSEVMEQQSELLRSIVQEQAIQLKEQSNRLMEEERIRIRQQFNSNKQKYTNT